jgi:hypothetical protein
MDNTSTKQALIYCVDKLNLTSMQELLCCFIMYKDQDYESIQQR